MEILKLFVSVVAILLAVAVPAASAFIVFLYLRSRKRAGQLVRTRR